MAFYPAFGAINIVGLPPSGIGIPVLGPQIAMAGGDIDLTNPTVVFYAADGSPPLFRLLAPGSYRCEDATFGGRPPGLNLACHLGPIATGGVIGTVIGTPGGQASRIGGEGTPFRADANETVWYGTDLTPGQAVSQSGKYTGHNVPTGTYVCGAAQFGPDPAPGVQKACFSVPLLAPAAGSTPITYYDQLAATQAAEDRAQAAYQAQQDLYQAQLLIEQTQQSADAAAMNAKMAQDAVAQQAAAQSAAETYRQIQQAASDQAAKLAARLALVAYQNAADLDAAAAAADMAAQAEAIRQATQLARADEATQTNALLAAQGAALVESGKQQVADAHLKAAQDAAAAQARLAEQLAAGGSGTAGGLDTTTMLLYGGLALAALLILKKD